MGRRRARHFSKSAHPCSKGSEAPARRYTKHVTTKETLHELIDNLSDEEAAELLAHVRRDAEREGATQPTSEAFWEFLDSLASGIPEEELKKLASSDEVDRVVYRLHGA